MSTRRIRRPRYRPALEGLESRQLLAVTYQSTFLPLDRFPDYYHGGVIPNSITLGPDQNVWFTIPKENYSYAQASVVQIRAATGGLYQYPTPTYNSSDTVGTVPGSIISGPGGDLWFVDYINTSTT